jgi:hypothetical protein
MVSNPRNLDQQSVANISDAIKQINFTGTVEREFTLAPRDPTKEASLEISIKDQLGKAIILPPLLQPTLVTEHIQYDPISLCVGYCGGRSIYVNYVEDRHCFAPKRNDAVFVPGTANFSNTVTQVGGYKIPDPTATSICVVLWSGNTSGTNSSGSSGFLMVDQAYFVPPQAPQ